ncbi:MAG: GH3 auxin-responsive promoter family protein [Planctomycetota bacterium]|jgi:hypothetical protein|nr:GH3 auxin-responsive promoter family protein [Planctomycetota bacterium]
MSKLLGWFFNAIMRNRTAAFARDCECPRAAQERSLRAILRRNASTDFGRAAGFEKLSCIKGENLWCAFRAAIPIRACEEFLPWVDRMKAGERDVLVPGRPQMFSLTSGTTSKPKFCPVTRAFIMEHHRQHLLWLHRCCQDHPSVYNGKSLVVASPAVMGMTAGGIPYGSMSGKQLETQSIPVRRRLAAPPEIFSLSKAEDRWFDLLLFALAQENLRTVTAINPSTLVLLADRLKRNAEALLDALERGHPANRNASFPPARRELARRFRPCPVRARRLREIFRLDGMLSPAAAWPNIQLILTWQGGSAAFYLPKVEELWGPVPRRCLGLRASEGTFSLPMSDNNPAGILAVGGHVVEFLPASDEPPAPDAVTLLADQLEREERYRMVITTSGGFYRYDLGDQIRVVGFRRKTPLIVFERRAGAVLSATGEKMTETQAMEAMRSAAAGLSLNGFSLTWELIGGRAGYVVAVECRNGEETLARDGNAFRRRLRELASSFDAELGRLNCEYAAKRQDGRLAPVRCLLLPDCFYEELRTRLAASGRPDGQLKYPILIPPSHPDLALFAGCGNSMTGTGGTHPGFVSVSSSV